MSFQLLDGVGPVITIWMALDGSFVIGQVSIEQLRVNIDQKLLPEFKNRNEQKTVSKSVIVSHRHQ